MDDHDDYLSLVVMNGYTHGSTTYFFWPSWYRKASPLSLRGAKVLGPRSLVQAMVVLDTVPDAAAWWCAVTQRWIQRVCREKDFRQPLQEYAVERARLQMVHLPERPGTATPPQGSTATPLQGSTTATPQGSTTATPPQGSTATPLQGSTTATPPQGSTATPPQGSTATPPSTATPLQGGTEWS